MNHLVEPLKNLGLSEKEVLVYLSLLQLGPSTPYKIAKKAGIKRPTAYVLAEELVEKGLIVNAIGEKNKNYIARSPETFISEWENKLKNAKEILPELKSFQKNSTEKPSIMYFEGIEGLRQAYKHREKEMHGKEIVGFYPSNEDASPEAVQVFMEWNEYKAAHKTKVKGIVVDTPALKSFGKFLEGDMINAKFLPKSIYNANVSIESCDYKFVRICFVESGETLIIESPKFSLAIKDIFELVWKSSEGKYDKPSTWGNK